MPALQTGLGTAQDVVAISNPIGSHHPRNDLDHDTYVTHALRSEGVDASEDGTGRGTPIVCGTLVSHSMKHGHAMTTQQAAESGQLVPDVAWALQERDSKGSDSSTKDGHLICATITSNYATHHGRTAGNNGGVAEGQLIPAVAFTERTRSNGRNFETQEEMAYALTNPGSGGRTHSRSIIANGVRRLTPIECERLQGFPDNWTSGFSDSTRYRMLGNAVSVPVAQWIAMKINC